MLHHGTAKRLAYRIKITPPAARQPLLSELLKVIDDRDDTYAGTPGGVVANNLRCMLDWPEVKQNPAAVAIRRGRQYVLGSHESDHPTGAGLGLKISLRLMPLRL